METARKLAAEIATRADAADRAGALPEADVTALKESGYLTLSIPREFGGYGLSLRDCVAAQIELAQGSASTALVAAMQVHIFGYQNEARLWPEAVFARFCRAAVAERALFNSVASEPLLGSPSRGGGFRTVAEQHPDGWLINGHKTWATGGRHLTHLLVRADMGGAPAVLLVYNHSPGVTWVETWSDSLSLRASDSHDVYFRDVLVPPDQVAEPPRPGFKPPPSAWFPAMIAATYLGAAIAARDAVIRYALERVPTGLGKPIATLPKIQRQIGEMDLALQAAQALMFEAAGQWSGAEDGRVQRLSRITAAKHFATQAACAVTEQALQVAGGVSMTKALPLERHFRDVRAGNMQPPSGDTALEIIGRAAIARQDQ